MVRVSAYDLAPRTMRRVLHKPQELPGHSRAIAAMIEGAVELKAYTFDGCRVIVCREPIGPGGKLEWHLSISREDRYPDWDEIAHARYSLLPETGTFGMILPPPSEYVNLQKNTFHLHELPARVEGW